MSEMPVEEPDRWILPLEGWTVERCVIDETFVVELKLGRRRARVNVHGTFILKTDRGSSKIQKSPLRSMAPALELAGRVVETAVALKDGRLDLKFRGGAALSVKPDRGFEAWTVTTGPELTLVCEPGGRVAVWVPEEE
ncbi:MAG: hypothetical protein HY303_14175 [Candidatus Wallbacteria bacterium]|nr:hypothetical protein [Candidatus Wallbacteria bacterium]